MIQEKSEADKARRGRKVFSGRGMNSSQVIEFMWETDYKSLATTEKYLRGMVT